jgi:predicted GTPase
MPDGDLAVQAVQRFACLEYLERHHVDIEEREEYEQHILKGTVVYAGVDYGAIIQQASAEADVIIFDGGNNDTPFFAPDLWVCVCDPHRAGHELSYYPGEINMRCADVIVINKANTAPKGAVDVRKLNVERVNLKARSKSLTRLD